MTQRRLRNRNGFNHSKQQIIENISHWTLVVLMVFQQLKTTAAVKFKGDNCFAKNEPGVCKEWGECPIIKTLIESGEYTNREVVSCGFGVREELICCPVRTEVKIDPPTNKDKDKDRSGGNIAITATTPSTEVPVKDFWEDLLKNTTNATTAAPDFWLDLLKPTTLKPLVIGGQKLNESSEFFDFNALLGGNQKASAKQTETNSQPNNQATIAQNGNGRGNNLNARPNNINQWNASFNNGRGNNNVQPQFADNGPSNFAWAQQNFARGPMNGHINLHRGLNNGRGPHSPFNNGLGHLNGRGPNNNNARVQNIWARENQNQGFTFPQNNRRPNNFFGVQENQRQEQNPNLTDNKSNSEQIRNSRNDDKKIEDLISNIFSNSDFEDDDPNLNESQNPFFNNPPNLNSRQPMVWLTPQTNDHNNHKLEFVHFPSLDHQMESRNPPVPGHVEITPVAGHLINSNDLEEPPSTNFIQQPVVVQAWPTNTIPSQTFNPVQVVYENSLNPGMGIAHAQETQLQPAANQPPVQVVVIQPQTPTSPQPPQIIYQQQHFGQQMESLNKGPRSTSFLPQQFAHQPQPAPVLHVQSPPIPNAFKPFEFRPPPAEENTFSEDNNSLSTNPSTLPDTQGGADRPAVRACRRIEKNLPPGLSHHILGGIPAELGEFPHMAGIGYTRIGGADRPPYDIRCGGTLIDKRFVLTAAHCVSERENIPSIVRLGVVNFTDAEQMSAAVEIRIKQTHIHDEYRTRLTYNDIAILELERDVDYSENIYPVCLYTDLKDPDPQIKLWVTGWGTVNTSTRSVSDILLKAPLHTSPLENCNKSFSDYGLNRRIPDGIRRTQFCAEDKDQIKDACQGDSGGPLNLVVDESYKNYRLVGVVSSGFGCASSTPGLYTRVAAFLDFIEKIVWPNGGD